VKKRTLARALTLQALFQVELGRIESEIALRNVLDDTDEEILKDLDSSIIDADAVLKRQDVRDYVEECLKGVLSHLYLLDESIKERADNWSFDRVGKVEKNILRIALYEIMFREDIPTNVSIDEAVALAKIYGDKDSGRFVNGILDSVNKKEVDGNDRTAGTN
jgi:transcription antitermination protein NusB